MEKNASAKAPSKVIMVEVPHPWTPTKRAESLTAAPPENCHELVAHGVGMRRATFPMSQIFIIPMVMLEGPLMGLEQNYSIRMLSSLYTLLNSRYSIIVV